MYACLFFKHSVQLQLLDHSESSGEDETQKHQQKKMYFLAVRSLNWEGLIVDLYNDLKEVNSIL